MYFRSSPRWGGPNSSVPRGEVLNPVDLSQLPSSAPLEMRITGLEPGTPLSSVLMAIWTDSSFSPHFVAHIGAAYIA
eukprot:gene1725-2024_t